MRVLNPTALVIDDEESVRKSLALFLSRSGFSVLEAADAAEARRLLDGHKTTIDLLLVDILLSGATGPDLVRTLFGDREETPVIFVTGMMRQKAVPMMKGIPRWSILQKPFTRLKPVMNFLREMSVLCKYIPALRLGWRNDEQDIQVTSAMRSGRFALRT